MADHPFDRFDDDDFEDFDRFEDPEFRLDDHESAMVRQDLQDLERFADAFAPQGYRGVAVFCQDCQEPHFYPWDMLEENLRVLLDTGETPVHEPAFEPNPEEYIPWEYARGYVDALADAGVQQRGELDACPRCGWGLADELAQANFCPRCGAPLLQARLRAALAEVGLDAETVDDLLTKAGLPAVSPTDDV